MTGARVIDLSDLLHEYGAGPFTGINRVTMAYVNHLLSDPAPLFGLAGYQWGWILLNRAAIADFAAGVSGQTDLQPATWPMRLADPGNPARQRALTLLYRRALARCTTPGLVRMLRRHLPPGSAWLAIGAANTRAPVLRRLREGAGLRIVIMVHDTIPLDFPQFVPVKGDTAFAERLRAVAAMSDLVIYYSNASRAQAERHMARWGRVPPAVVAPLGITPLLPDPAQIPASLDLSRPSFVILGTIEPRKNHALLLDLWERFAAEAVNQPDKGPVPALLILGRRGWRNDAVFRRLDQSPQRGRDIFELSNLPDGAVAAILARARALLFPSHAEGFGLPAIEAASLGTPVICNDLPVYHEFMGAYPTYIPVADADRWAAAIRALSTPAPPRRNPPFDRLPSWERHFATVLAQV